VKPARQPDRSRLGLVPRALALLLALTPQALDAQSVALELDAGYADVSNASRSMEAVFGSSGGFVWGGTLRCDVTKSIFLSVGTRVLKRRGERVFIADASSDIFPLGHPLRVRIVPLRLSAGYRFTGLGATVPYVGGGAGLVWFREWSTVGGISQESSEKKSSFHVLAGADYGKGSIGIGAELSYSWVPDAIGVGGVSAIYEETDIGGFQIVGKLVLSRAR
jgi:opacity protein-like surface antigen